MATAPTHRGQGGDYVQEVARNEAIFKVRETPKGVCIEMPERVYLYADDDKPGGARVTLSAGVYRDGIGALDLIAMLALVVQRGVAALEAK